MMCVTELELCSVQTNSYPVYQHELEKFFLYYNSSQAALVIGPLQSQGLLKVQRTYELEMASDVDYTLSHLFTFSAWKQWDAHRSQFVENRNMSHMRPECVDENFGFCLSGYLYPSNLYDSVVEVVGPRFEWREYVDFSQLYFKLLDNVFHNLRPVYEIVNEYQNRTSQHRTTQRYLYHENGKWRVGAEIGTDSLISGIILELEGNAMRVEYENATEWYWLEFSKFSPTHTYRRAFGHLQCRRQLPDGISCQTAGVTACENGGTCRTNSEGMSSCYCPARYRGIRCEHHMVQCITSFQSPPQASVLGGREPHYEGSVLTVFCSSGEVQYSLCQNGVWHFASYTKCYMTTTTSTTTRVWIPVYNESNGEYIAKDSTEMIATVIVVLVCVQLGFPFLCYCCIACCQPDEEQDEVVPADEELKIESKKRSTSLQRTCSGFFYVCWWVWLGFIIIYFLWYGHIPIDGSTVTSAIVIMAFVCLGVLYSCVFSESFCSHEYDYLTKLENEEVTVGEQITEMKVAKPTIVFKAECAHNETKTRTVYKFSCFLLLVYLFSSAV